MESNARKPVTAVSVKMFARISLNDDGDIRGELDCVHFEEHFAFTGIASMIKKMESTFDAKGFPEKQVLPRSFNKTVKRDRKQEPALRAYDRDLLDILSQPGADDKAGVFEISVRFRHNAEWQGSFRNFNGGDIYDFDSVIELVRLINKGLDNTDTSSGEKRS